jgi:hypothetical protein
MILRMSAKFLHGIATVALFVMSPAASNLCRAQQATPFTNFVGVWEGRTSTNRELALGVDPGGKYVLSWLSGPSAASRPSGLAELQGGELLIRYTGGEIRLQRQADGLSGTYVAGQSRGTVTLAVAAQGGSYQPRTVAAPAATSGPGSIWAIGRWVGVIINLGWTTNAHLRNRGLTVAQRPEGGLSCRWSVFPDSSPGDYAKKCEIGSSGISFVAPDDSDIRLTRTSDGVLIGTMKNRVEFDPGAQTKIHLNRKP